MSTPQGNCLVQVDDEAEHKPEWMVTREQKLAILGPDSLTATQKNVEMGDQVVLFHWEKPVKLWEEIFHHLRAHQHGCGLGGQVASAPSGSEPRNPDAGVVPERGSHESREGVHDQLDGHRELHQSGGAVLC